MKNKIHTVIASLAAIALSAAPAAFGAPKNSPSPSPSAHASPTAKPEAPSTRAIPFHGTISAVDQSAKTFTIAGKEASRVFKVTDKTVITKDGAPAKMTDIAANEDVSGSYWKAADGSLEAKTVKLGKKAETKSSDTKTTKKKAADTSGSPSPAASAFPKP